MDLFEQIGDDKRQTNNNNNNTNGDNDTEIYNIRTQKLIDLNSIRAIFILKLFLSLNLT